MSLATHRRKRPRKRLKKSRERLFFIFFAARGIFLPCLPLATSEGRARLYASDDDEGEKLNQRSRYVNRYCVFTLLVQQVFIMFG